MNKTALRPNSWSFYFQCQWNITVRTGRTIAITFEEFKVLSTDTTLCQESSVVVRRHNEVISESSHVHAVGLPDYVSHKSNESRANTSAILRNLLDAGEPFPALFVNNSNFLRNGGSSDSPPLGNGKYCGTTIPVVNQTTGNKLCTKEYVELFDGGSQSAKLLGHYCSQKPSSILTTGNMLSVHYFTETTDPHNGFLANIAIGHYCTQKPSSILTTGNMLSVHYFTETTDPHNGFLANIAIATCGGTLRGWIGTLTSPSYPGSYPTNQDCTWLIEGVLGHYLTITFQEIKIISMFDCSGDYIEILESFDYNNTERRKVGVRTTPGMGWFPSGTC
ncbi:unnamed protein product, partial [Timema podura]|nr:unnamed protein product [Timema podura]